MNIIQDIISLFLISLIPCSFGYLLDYCLGKPGSDEVNTKAIFFKYSLFLAVRRLKINNRKNEIERMFSGMLNTEDKGEFLQAKKQYLTTLFNSGREHFTWEQAFGMCIFCSNVWICLLTCLVVTIFIPLQINPFIVFITIPAFSHLILRKL